MGGALIVNGGLDDAPGVSEAVEKILVIQQFSYTEVDGEPAFVDPGKIYSQEGEYVEAINGVVTPTIVMQPGEVQRWRIIHAGMKDVTELDIGGVNFHEIAVDGLATGKVIERNKLLLYPGYRIDVLVQAPGIPLETLMTTSIDDPNKSTRNAVSEERALLRVVVKGDPKPMRIPTSDELAPYAAFTDADVPAEVSNTRTIRFSTSDDGTRFFIDGEEFDAEQIKQTMELNSSEEWELVSEGGTHPFHIHVNPFAARLRGSDDPWVWRDTVAVRNRRPVEIRTTYESFTGKTVLHCHNLWHEDEGMMQAIEIVEPTDADPDADVSTRSLPVAPLWNAVQIDGTGFTAETVKGKRVLMVFHRGMSCLHCAQQMRILHGNHQRFAEAGIEVVAISQFLPDNEPALKTISNFKFPVLIDTGLKAFEKFDCISSQGVPDHALILINEKNEIIFSEKTSTAVVETTELVDRIIQLVQ